MEEMVGQCPILSSQGLPVEWVTRSAPLCGAPAEWTARSAPLRGTPAEPVSNGANSELVSP